MANWPSVDGKTTNMPNGKFRVSMSTVYKTKKLNTSAVADTESAAKFKARRQLTAKCRRVDGNIESAARKEMKKRRKGQ